MPIKFIEMTQEKCQTSAEKKELPKTFYKSDWKNAIVDFSSIGSDDIFSFYSSLLQFECYM